MRGTSLSVSSVSLISLVFTALLGPSWENTPRGIPALDNFIGFTWKRTKKKAVKHTKRNALTIQAKQAQSQTQGGLERAVSCNAPRSVLATLF